MSKKEMWEYKITRTTEEYTPDLNALGQKGWELVTVVSISNDTWQDYKYFFKRKLRERKAKT